MKAIVQLRQQSNDQLQNRLVQIGNDMMRAKGSLHGNVKSPQIKNPMFIRHLRREKAQILTILHERRIRKETAK
jgi:ribosomal protein L29